MQTCKIRPQPIKTNKGILKSKEPFFNWLNQDGAINDPFSSLTKVQQTLVRLGFKDGHSNKEIVPKIGLLNAKSEIVQLQSATT